MPCSNELCCKWICPALSLSCTYPLVLEKGNKTGFISLLIKHNEVRGPRLMAMAFKNTKLSNRCWDLYFFNLSSNPDNYTTEITIVTAPWRRKCHVKDASGHYLQGCYSHSAAPPSPFQSTFCALPSVLITDSRSVDRRESSMGAQVFTHWNLCHFSWLRAAHRWPIKAASSCSLC